MATTYFGTTQADFSVDANGGATYRIQLEVPPGILKLEPHLALVYNSNTGNGTLGLGWQLEGLSMITRSPQTMAQDSVRGAVSYTENDRFSMDGKRLMLSSGTSYSAQDAVYHTELECWQQVVPQFSDVAGRSGPDSFVVTLPDGKVMEYGGTPDSAIMASSDNPTIRVWLLNRVTDLHGNYIDFSYQPDPGNSFAYLAGITYGGNLNSSVTAQRAVQFHYTARPDYFPTYAGGYGSTCRQLLDQIQTSLNGELIRTYTLAYQQGAATGRSQLISLTEADADGAVKNESGLYTGGNAMPATSLAWAEESLTLFDAAPATYSSEQPWQGTMLPVDVDGNGRTDLINVYRDGSNVSFAVFLSDGSGYSAPAVFSTTVPYYSNMQVLPLDVNGDGCTDLVIVQNSGTNSIVYVLLSQVDAEGNFQGFAPATSLLLNGSNGQPSVPANAVALAMDVDGDGLTDLVFSSQNGSLLNLQILFSDGTTFAPSETDGTAQSIAQAKVPYYARAQYLPMDFAGSGMTDLLYGYGSQNFTFCLLLSKGRNGLIAQTVSPLASGVTVPVFGTLVPVDINGDGLGDLVQAYLDGSNLVVQTFVSNGVTLQAGASQTFATTMFGTGAPMFSIAQLNGNGIPDLLFFTRNNTQMGILALLGNGLGFQPAGSMLSATLPPNGTSLTMASVTQPPASVLYSAHALPLDVDGDGITEIAFAAPSGGNVSIVVQPSTPGWPGLVRTITDGLGGEFQLSFSPLTDPEVYTRNLTTPTGIVEPAGLLSASVTGATFMLSSAATFGAESPGTTPTTRLADFPRYVLASYSKSDGRGGVYPTQCSYAHALVDLTGRGWLGFASMRTVARFVDPISQQLSPSNADHLTVYNQLFPLTGREASSLLCRASDGAWMQYTTHAYQSTMLSTGI
ncbi:MAG TPA: FG-GAP-like repeat-containing protein, partial [Terracidiphilus sp.]